MNFVVSSCQVGCKLATQQPCVASSNYNMQTSAKKTVDKQMPTFHILHFVKKNILYVRAISLIDAREHGVQVFRLQFYQTIIIKVRIAIFNTLLQ